MFVIGVSGGIGSGKTAVTDHFKTLGVDVIDADIAARTVVEKGKPALLRIQEYFGEHVILASGELDRAALREIIFKNEYHRKWLEALTHPLIRNEIINGLQNAKSPYVILASPLLIESGQYKLVNRTLIVDVSEETQITRTCERDNNDPEQVQAIIKAQLSRNERLKHADDIIDNEGNLATLIEQVNNIHQRYLEMSK